MASICLLGGQLAGCQDGGWWHRVADWLADRLETDGWSGDIVLLAGCENDGRRHCFTGCLARRLAQKTMAGWRHRFALRTDWLAGWLWKRWPVTSISWLAPLFSWPGATGFENDGPAASFCWLSGCERWHHFASWLAGCENDGWSPLFVVGWLAAWLASCEAMAGDIVLLAGWLAVKNSGWWRRFAGWLAGGLALKMMAGCENDGWSGGIVLLAGWVAAKRWLMASFC